jgi:signal transduction histidine kinase
MQPQSVITPQERALYQGYDQQRRLDLTRGIAPVFGAILFIFIAILNIDAPLLPSQVPGVFHTDAILTTLLITDPIFAACIIAFAIATRAARRERVAVATTLTIIATDVAVIAIEFLWTFGLGGLDVVAVGTFSALCMAILLAGVLGERWMLLATTLLMNLVITSVAIFGQPPHPSFEAGSSIADLINSEKLLFISGAYLVQWAVATIMLSTGNTYQRIIRELGDVRVAYERARQLDELKDLFITSINHELRSPVMAMQGFIELMKLAEHTATPEKRNELLERARGAGDNLVALLSSILDARRLDRDADAFTPTKVNVRAAISSAASLIDPREGALVSRDLRISVPRNLDIWGDNIRLQQILTNLLSNAIKYSDPGTPIEVAAKIVYETPKRARWFTQAAPAVRPMADITVRDYGLGIPKNEATLLFQRFARLPRDLASTTLGNGLGLHLCRVLAEAMGGAIWVESAGLEGQGSTFHVVLPLPNADALAAMAQATPVAARA